MQRRHDLRPEHGGRWLPLVWLLLAALPLTGSAQAPPASAPPAQAPAPLRLVSTSWPPFTTAPGSARFALDLVETALKTIGVPAETTFVEAAAFTPSLLSAGFDGSAAAWKDAAREEVLLYSEPYLENRLLLVGRRGTDVSATTLAALSGKRIAVVGGYAYGDAVASSTSGPQFTQSSSEEDSLAQLLAGRVDYTLMDELVIQYILRNHGEQAKNRLQIGTTPLIIRPLYLAIRRSRPDAASIIRRFNAELRQMITNRTYHKLLHVEWIRADVDGDGRTELVSASDRLGSAPPTTGYDLFRTPVPAQSAAESGAGTTRFYMGGNIYETWASVPDMYKLTGSDIPNPDQHTGSIFRFAW